jgi:hypothetical protein
MPINVPFGVARNPLASRAPPPPPLLGLENIVKDSYPIKIPKLSVYASALPDEKL